MTPDTVTATTQHCVQQVEQERVAQLTQLASHQRMNTDVRRAVFCTLMGASDFEDAFEKLSRLELKGQQDREIVRVLVDCCGQEKAYNPYYALTGARFCEAEVSHSQLLLIL
jgi:nucleolar MIF4G domain-containing protein 1